MSNIVKGARIQFENGRDVLRGTVVAKYVDPKRPTMEETWTCYADQVLVRVPKLDEHGDQVTQPGELLTHGSLPITNVSGKQKRQALPAFTESWATVVDADGVQACDSEGQALHQSASGGPLQLVKSGLPIPFRVRARRMTVL